MRILVTGTPGTGKSAVLGAIAADVLVVEEAARPVLRALRADGLDPSDPEVFVPALLDHSINSYTEASTKGSVLFDRGVPDCIAYADWLGADPEPSRRAAEQYRYHQTALLFRPWEGIYTTDGERTMSYEQTVAWAPMFERVYRELGYELVEVPRGSIEERARFVEEFVLATAG